MGVISAITSFFKIGSKGAKAISSGGKAASAVSKSVETVTKAGKTIVNAAKGSKIVLQMGEVGGKAAKGIQAASTASKAWIIAKWGVLAAAAVGIGAGIKNILSGLFGSAYDGVSSILQSFGLPPEQADTGTSIIFVALFVAIILYALPYLMDRVPQRKPRPNRSEKIREKAKDDWMIIARKDDMEGMK